MTRCMMRLSAQRSLVSMSIYADTSELWRVFLRLSAQHLWLLYSMFVMEMITIAEDPILNLPKGESL